MSGAPLGLPDVIQRNLTRITTTVSLIAAVVFALTVVDGVSTVTRLAGFVFAVSATIEIVNATDTVRPHGTAMVSVAAFMLTLEGGGSAIANGMDKASFIEMLIGVYLLVTLWMMVRR